MWKVVLFILLLFLCDCTNLEPSTESSEDSFSLQNKLNLFSGDTNENDSHYNIGILIDRVIEQQARDIVNQSLGSSSFSLFKTIPFDSNKINLIFTI